MKKLQERINLQLELNTCSDVCERAKLIEKIDAWDQSLENVKSLAGQPITNKVIFGINSRYAVYGIHTRFEDVAWVVADADTTDPLTGFPGIIAQEGSIYTVLDKMYTF